MIIMRNRKRETAYNNLPIGLNKYNNITLTTKHMPTSENKVAKTYISNESNKNPWFNCSSKVS